MKRERIHRISLRPVIYALVAGLAVMLCMCVVAARDTAAGQTAELGNMRLQNIAAGFQHSLDRAESALGLYGESLTALLDLGASEEDISAFLADCERRETDATDGACLTVFAVVDGQVIISSGEAPPDDYILQDRMWYRGLLATHDSDTYISPVYEAAFITEGACFTIARMLPDSHRIIGMDVSVRVIEGYVDQMLGDRYGQAVIVDSNETIIGCAEAEHVGLKLSAAMSDFREIYSRASTSVRANLSLRSGSKTYFSSRTDNGWYLLCAIEGDAIQQEAYGRLNRDMIISLALLAAVVACAVIEHFLRRQERETMVERARFTLHLYGRLSAPLKQMRGLFLSDSEAAAEDPDTARRIHAAGRSLTELYDSMTGEASKLAVVLAEDPARKQDKPNLPGTPDHPQDENDPQLKTLRKQRKYQVGITIIFLVTMVIAMTVSTTMVISDSRLRMKEELKEYAYTLDAWVDEQKGILTMFEQVILAKPEMLEDYDGMVSFLSSVASYYQGISTAFIANPDFAHGHAMIMNNGWVPEADFNVETRAWYTGALTSTGINVTAPYITMRTGQYCITFSKVIESADGEYYGVFGLDYYLDVLSGILGKPRSSDEYAFLVDKNGFLLDHPFGTYNSTVSIRSLPYNTLYSSPGMAVLRDYDGRIKVCAVIEDPESGFDLIVVKEWMSVYGNIFRYLLLYLALFGVCILAVNFVIHGLLAWQRRTNDSLREVAEDAIRAEQAKLQFLSNISHELRTPINAVLGMNEMILREATDETLQGYAMNIQSSGKTLLFLINDILDMSKIESGKMNIVPVNYAPGELFTDLWSMIYLRAQEKGLAISFDLDPNIPRLLFGDDVRIKQIVTNILTNAVKYTPKGSIRLTTRFVGTGFKMVNLMITVKDTGIGIKEEDRGKLFESFQRLEEEKNRNIEGAGLGMSITTSLLRQMGGRMEVDSVYGQGSTFTVIIPQRVIENEPMGDFETIMAEHNQVRQTEHQAFEAPEARILAVDDNEMNLAVFRALLRRTKVQIITASSGKRCLELVQQERYDMIFMDHMMPEMDGIETLHAIRGLTDFPNANTPVIVLTANALVGARESYIKEGFADFLTKPIDSVQLDRMVLKYLPPELVRAAGQAAPPEPEQPSAHGEYESYGISVAQGLHYSTGNMDVYLDLIAMFVRDVAREPKLAQYLAGGDLKDYSILVHSLKGNARTLGAQKLADIAFDHEKESKAGNAEFLRAHWDELLTAWRAAKDGLARLYEAERGEALPIPDPSAGQPSPAGAPEAQGEALTITPAQLAQAAELIDQFESEKAAAQLKEWLRHPLDPAIRDRVQAALTALEDEFDEGRAMKLLRQEP